MLIRTIPLLLHDFFFFFNSQNPSGFSLNKINLKTLIINANLFGHFYFRETKGHDAYYIMLELKILGDENDYLYV
jgi:hypothetical protein